MSRFFRGRGRAFCSGADVHQRQLRSREEFERLGGPQGHGANSGDLLMQSVNWKPVIAAVHGYVLGLGLGMVLDCDLIVAEAGTKFHLTETSRGLGSAKQWAQLHFRSGAFADEIALTGRYFTAEEALAGGLINRVAPEGKLLEAAQALAEEVAANPPLSVRAVVRTRRWRLGQVVREAAFQQTPMRLYLTEDFHEAALAFQRKTQAARVQRKLIPAADRTPRLGERSTRRSLYFRRPAFFGAALRLLPRPISLARDERVLA